LAFILDRNGINMVISRAQCLAVVVAVSRLPVLCLGRWMR